MGSYFSDIFNAAHDDVPLAERDIVRVADRGFWQGDDTLPGRSDSRAMNFQTMVATGAWPQVEGLAWNDQHIDWSSDDAYTRAIKQVRENSQERIRQDPELYALLDKDSWSREDRVAWERGVSAIVNEEHMKIPGLATYRNVSQMVDDPENDGKKVPKYPTVERRASRLNDLSVDIENDTMTIEHDCESMAIFEGVVLQQIDNYFMSAPAPDGEYKQSANYFYVTGRSNFSVGLSGLDSGHAWVLSSATANVIEATSVDGKSVYREGVDTDTTFEAFVRGQTFYGEGGSIYASYGNSFDDITRMRIDRGDIDFDKIYESIPLRGEITQKTFDEAPPEAQSLIELKTRIVQLEKAGIDENGIQTEPGRMSAYRSRFDQTLSEMVDDAGIYSG